jgi:hypothetical protein
MDENAPHQMRWPRVVARVTGTMVLVTVVYILSFGPVYYFLSNRSPKVSRALVWFYAPMEWMSGLYNLSKPGLPYGEYGWWWSHLPGGPMERVQNPDYFVRDPRKEK